MEETFLTEFNQRLEAKDFRIKNLVDFEGKIYEIHTIADVFPTLNTSEFGIGVIDWNNIKPITLTEEWLLKFGFTRNKDTYYLNDLGLSWLTTEDNFQTEYKLADSKWKLLDLKFVHQLQNLYFALCGDELKLKETL